MVAPYNMVHITQTEAIALYIMLVTTWYPEKLFKYFCFVFIGNTDSSLFAPSADPPRCELPAETGALVSQNQLINTTSETYSREYFLNLIGELIMGTILLIVLILLLVPSNGPVEIG